MTDIFDFKYHQFEVPLDWNDLNATESIKITLREVIQESNSHKPPIIYLQGGPGFEVSLPTDESWIKKLGERFSVFLLDQRGTGLSSPVDIKLITDLYNLDSAKAIDFLTYFRADSIAKDVEQIRKALFHDQDFYTYGQSFGGWCTLSYISQFPSSATGSLITGGYAPIGHDPKDVYRSIVPQVDRSNKQFLEIYPNTMTQLQELINTLDSDTLFLLAQKGFYAGYSSLHSNLRSTIESLYFDISNLGRASTRSLNMLKDPLGFIDNPLYALLHESLYCDNQASSWASQSVMIEENARPATDELNKFFLGENVLKNSFSAVDELKPLMPIMEDVMAYDKWNPQFDKVMLSTSETPVIGVVYENDAAVSREYSLETASILGNGHVLESDLDHSAYKTNTDVIFNLLFERLDVLSK